MHISHVNDDELKAYLASLPVEDEELSDQECEAIAEGELDVALGNTVSAAEVAHIVDAPTQKAS